MIIVTSGSEYLDIDAYGGCLAYAELLRLQGLPARAVSNAPLNGSIPPSVLAWGGGFDAHAPAPDDSFVLVDVSDLGHLDVCVKLDAVAEVIDHHPGFEDYWRMRLGDAACIERVGAACTQVFERWSAASAVDRMTVRSARLLLTAILDNTLNFLSKTTTARDIAAYEALCDIAGLPDDWAGRYFAECQEGMENDLSVALRRDTKLFPPAGALPSFMGQLTTWDGRRIVRDQRQPVAEAMRLFGEDWAVNVLSICDERSYLVAESPASQEKMSTLLDVEFTNGVAVCEELILRKEMLRYFR